MIKSLLITLCLFTSLRATAQESMLGNVSPGYVEKLVAQARTNYPKFKLTAANVEVARIGINKAKLSWFDFLQLSYGYTPTFLNRQNGINYYNQSQIGIFMNIGTILQKPAIVRQAREQYTVASLEKEVMDRNIETLVRQRYYLYLKQLSILQLRVSMQSDASDQLKGLKFKFEKGEITFESYNQAQLAYSSQAQERITAEADMLIARNNLEELLGTKLENVQ